MTQTTPDALQPAFTGFPAGARATAVPSAFFTELLPQIEDPDELRVTLYVIYALGRRKGYPRFVTARELHGEGPLLASLGDAGDPASVTRLESALMGAVARGTLLRTDVDNEGRADALYFLNTPGDRRAAALVREGRLDLGRPLAAESAPPASRRENVFALYEQNIGPMTPLVAEELREAEKLYPYEWLEEAMRESALQNKRSWRYTAAILQRWATEGRKHETARRDPGTGDSARAQFLRRYRDLRGE